MHMTKTMYRGKNKIIAGVCSGIAEYYDIDVTVLRLCVVLIFIFTGFFPMGIFYILAIIIMPASTHHTHHTATHTSHEHSHNKDTEIN